MYVDILITRGAIEFQRLFYNITIYGSSMSALPLLLMSWEHRMHPVTINRFPLTINMEHIDKEPPQVKR